MRVSFVLKLLTMLILIVVTVVADYTNYVNQTQLFLMERGCNYMENIIIAVRRPNIRSHTKYYFSYWLNLINKTSIKDLKFSWNWCLTIYIKNKKLQRNVKDFFLNLKFILKHFRGIILSDVAIGRSFLLLPDLP